MARPTSFTPEMVSKAREYVDSCEDKIEDVISGQSEKFTSYKQKTTVRLPTIEGLAFFLKIHKDTIYEWEKIHDEFSDVINDLRAKQAERLINMGLSGDYNPYIAKVLLTKHGYNDKQEVENTGSVKHNHTITGMEIL